MWTSPLLLPTSLVSPNRARIQGVQLLSPLEGLPLGRNPLIVQFWLLGQDALNGDLTRRGFNKHPTPDKGSSLYRSKAWSVHSSSLWTPLQGGYLYYLRPRECFVWLEHEPTPGEHYPDAYPISRSKGLRLLQPYLLEHEGWITAQRGAQHRNLQLERSKTPPRVRHQVWGWHRYISRHLDLRVWGAKTVLENI